MKKKPIDSIIQSLIDLGLPESKKNDIVSVTINPRSAFVTVTKKGVNANGRQLTERITLPIKPGPTL